MAQNNLVLHKVLGYTSVLLWILVHAIDGSLPHTSQYVITYVPKSTNRVNTVFTGERNLSPTSHRSTNADVKKNEVQCVYYIYKQTRFYISYF